MKKHYKNYFLLVMILFFFVPSFYCTRAESKILISTKWLAEHLTDQELVILYIGKKDEFYKEHIPGARIISMKELIIDYENGFRHELPDDEKLQTVFRNVGINQDSKVVICYSDENVIPLATRLYFTLDYAGLGEQSAILNGGLIQWKNEKRQLSSEATDFEKGNFTIKKNAKVLANKEMILKNLDNPDAIIVDARPEEQYDGSEEDNNSLRRGHIEGAVNLPFYNLQQEENSHLFKSDTELLKAFEELGIKKNTLVIIYCGSGIWTSPVYFVGKYLGYDVRLYDASFQEWGNDEKLPITSPVTFDSEK